MSSQLRTLTRGALLSIALLTAAATATAAQNGKLTRADLLVTSDWLATQITNPKLVLLHVGELLLELRLALHISCFLFLFPSHASSTFMLGSVPSGNHCTRELVNGIERPHWSGRGLCWRSLSGINTQVY